MTIVVSTFGDVDKMCEKSQCNCKPTEKNFKVGQVWKTKGGSKVTILSTEAQGGSPIVGQVVDGMYVYTWNKDGSSPSTSFPNWNLVEEWKEPRKKTSYVHLVQHANNGTLYNFTYNEIKKTIGGYLVLGVKKVESVEGEFDIPMG